MSSPHGWFKTSVPRWVKPQGTDPEDTTSDFGLLGHNKYRMIYVFYLIVYKHDFIT